MVRLAVKYLAGVSGFSLFGTTIFAPTTLMPVKYILIAVFLSTFALYVVMRREFRIDLAPIVITTAIVLVGVIWTLYGTFRRNPGAASTVTVYLLYPLLFTLLSATAITSYRTVYRIQMVLLATAGGIILYTYIYIGYSAEILPSLIYLPLPLQQNIGFYDGFVEYTMDNIASLLFLVPYLLTAAAIWPADTEHTPPKRFVWALLLFSIPLVFLSGRRAFQIVVMLTIPIIGGIWLLLPHSNRKKIWPHLNSTIPIFPGIIICIFILLEATVLDTMAVVHRLTFAFNPSTSFGASTRLRQFVLMMGELQQQPLIGYGFGSVVEGIIRSASQPWSYELMYVKILHDVGILGFLPYLIGFTWLCRRQAALIQSGSILGYHIAPIFVGMISFIIASASNPYLGKFGYMWVIFVPLGIVHFASAYNPQVATTQLLEIQEAEVDD